MRYEEPVIGVLGGMGPFATIAFLNALYSHSPVSSERDYPRILVDLNTKIPSRTRALKYSEETPVNDMVSSINNLCRGGASFVVVPCNSAHYFYSEVSKTIDRPWLNMIDVMTSYLNERGLSRPLILGGFVTVISKLYSFSFKDALYLDEAGNEIVWAIIEEVKKHGGSVRTDYLNELLDLCERQSADCVVLACTELTFISQQIFKRGLNPIDTTKVYASATMSYVATYGNISSNL
jgi:aspartate racemase